MRVSLASVLAFAPLAALASNVVEVTTKSFQASLGSVPSLVEFYAPWCGHCKNLAPVYEQLADAFSAHKRKVQIVKTDADGEGKDIAKKFGVSGYPTLKWFPNGSDGQAETYEGSRDLDSLVQFITKKTGLKGNIKPPPPPNYVSLDSTTFNGVVMDADKDVLVTFTAPWCGHCKSMKPYLDKVALTFKDEPKCIVADLNADSPENKPLANDYNVNSYPTIKFFPKGSSAKEPVDYTGPRTEEGFTAFLNEHCGTNRAVGGGLNDLAGRVATLDTFASQIVSVVKDARSDVLTEATNAAEELGDKGKYYVKVMEKIVNGVEGWLEKETKRLATILQKKTLAPSKLDEIKIKANILAAFVEKKVEEVTEEVEEAAQHIKEEL